MRSLLRAAVAAAACLAGGAQAASVADVLAARVAEHEQARAVQGRIDAALGRRLDPADVLAAQQLDAALARAAAELEAERAQLAELERRVAARERAGAEMLPLLRRMLDLLEASIARDLPAELVERRAQVAAARARLNDAAATAADRMSAVLDVYAHEQRLAASVTRHSARVQIDGRERVMTVLRVGRVALFAATSDGRECAVYQRTASRWQWLPGTACSALEGSAQDLPVELLLGLPGTGPR